MTDCHRRFRRLCFSSEALSHLIGRFESRRLTSIFVILVLAGSSLFVIGLVPGMTRSDSGPADLVLGVMATGSPPSFPLKPKDPTVTDAGVQAIFTAIVTDPNIGDTINVTWEWGDGTANSTNITGPMKIPPTHTSEIVENYHTYNPTPEQGREAYVVSYTMNCTLDDGNGNIVTEPTTVDVTVPASQPPLIISLSVPTTGVDPIETVLISANASDPEGESLTWTFVFNNSIEVYETVVNHTGASTPGEVVWCNITHVFGTLGEHTITLNLSDALPPHQVWPHNISSTITVQVVANGAPNASSDISVDPNSPIVRSELRYEIVNYSVQAFDVDGDVITATWNFSDGSPDVVNTSAGGTRIYTFVQQRNYTEAGEFNISVVISDGRPGHDILIYKLVTIGSTNRGPSIVSVVAQLPPGRSYALRNETTNFTMVIQDDESDPIEVIIDFGDGSPLLYMNLTGLVESRVTATFSHAYSDVGNYTISIRYSDNKIGLFEHTSVYNITVTVLNPTIVPSISWDWWDYTSLAMFCMIPVIIVLRFIQVAQKRKRLEAEGMTLEEWRLLASETAREGMKTK